MGEWDYTMKPGELVFVDDSYPGKILGKWWDSYFRVWRAAIRNTRTGEVEHYHTGRVIHRAARHLVNHQYRVRVYEYDWSEVPPFTTPAGAKHDYSLESGG